MAPRMKSVALLERIGPMANEGAIACSKKRRWEDEKSDEGTRRLDGWVLDRRQAGGRSSKRD